MMLAIKIAVGFIFVFVGAWFFQKGIRASRSKGIGAGLVELSAGLGIIILGLLVWLGYIT